MVTKQIDIESYGFAMGLFFLEHFIVFEKPEECDPEPKDAP